MIGVLSLDIGTLGAIGGLLIAAGTAIGTIIGFLIKAKVQLNAEKRIDRQYEDQQFNRGYEYVIATLTTQNEKLEKERKEQIGHLSEALEEVRNRERECIKVQEGLRVQNLEQQKDINRLSDDIETLKQKFGPDVSWPTKREAD